MIGALGGESRSLSEVALGIPFCYPQRHIPLVEIPVETAYSEPWEIPGGSLITISDRGRFVFARAKAPSSSSPSR